jgi:glycosyltransferase involved in cell wall biosynthesis
LLKSHSANRSEARARLGLDEHARIVLAPGLETASKSLEVAEAAVDAVRRRTPNTMLVVAGGGESGEHGFVRRMGRVDLQTLGDALLAADVVLALRFPSRGEASGVVMRALAASRALIVSAGSTADEDLPDGVVGRVHPGPAEALELAALIEFVLTDEEARLRLERLSGEVAASRGVEPLTLRFADFLREVARDRATLESKITSRESEVVRVRKPVRNEIEAAAASLGLTHLPSNVFERLAGL